MHFTIHCEDQVQYIEMPFAPYGRAMSDACCLDLFAKDRGVV